MSRIVITLCNPDLTGASKMARLYAQAFIAAGHEVLFIHGPENAPIGSSDPTETPFLDSIRTDGVKTELLPGLTFPLLPSVVNNTAKIARQFGADCLIGAQQRDRAVALKAANKLKVPGINFFQSIHEFHGKWPIPYLKERYYTQAIQNFLTLGICVSDAVRQQLTDRFKVDQSKLEVVYNGVDVLGFPEITKEQKTSLRQEFNVQPDELMLVNSGRISTQKGLVHLTSAIQQVIASGRKVKMIQIGSVLEGPNHSEMSKYFNDMKSFLKEHQLEEQFIFAGWRNDCAALLKAADMYVHSALWEGWALAVVEALAAKLPTIFTDCTGHPEGFINGTHGDIVPKGDSKALAEAMNRMIDLTTEERTQIGQAGYEFAAKNYEITATAPKFVKLVEDVLK